MKNLLKSNSLFAMVIGCAVLVGCADPNDKLEPKDPTASKETKEYVPMAAAGVGKDIAKSQDPNRYKPLILATSRFGHRSNPFALNKDEISFDMAQAQERITIEGGSFGSLYQLPDDKNDAVIPVEAQPYRRLSGILIGDSVLAILEEGGKSTIIRPGMLIPGTDWRVISIDRDRAILRRDGNTLPKEVEVRLEIGFPSGVGGTGQQGGGQRGGGPPTTGPAGAGTSPGGGVSGAGAG